MSERTCTICDCPRDDVAAKIDIGGKPVEASCSQVLNETSIVALRRSES